MCVKTKYTKLYKTKKILNVIFVSTLFVSTYKFVLNKLNKIRFNKTLQLCFIANEKLRARAHGVIKVLI